MNLHIDEVSHTFPGRLTREALYKVSLEVPSGEFLAIIGPSGCGKSTLLRLIVNQITPSAGKIRIDGKTPAEAVAERRIAWMAQSPALLPWLTVEGNVRLALKFHSPERPPSLSALEALRLVGLEDVAAAYPKMLSGGMQQRLALARTLVMDAGLWLMDEPFAALDELTRERLTHELGEIWFQLRPTVLWVTHNIYEALRLADRILVLSPHPGRVVGDLHVDIPRPRQESDAGFQFILSHIRQILNQYDDQGGNHGFNN